MCPGYWMKEVGKARCLKRSIVEIVPRREIAHVVKSRVAASRRR